MSRIRAHSFLFILLLAVLPAARGQTRHPRRTTLTPREIAQRTLPSVVVLFVQNSENHTRSIGTGFFVDTDIIATNYHVVRNASEIYAKLITQKQVLRISAVIQVDKEKDLALLRVQGIRLKPLPLGKAGDSAIGDEIYVVGNPEGWEGTFSQGIISGFRKMQGSDYVQVTAPVSHGSSGGPVLNGRGEVIGMITSANKEGQNLNFAISSADLLAFQKSAMLEYDSRDFFRKYSTPAELLTCEGNEYYRRKDFVHAAEKHRVALRTDANLAQTYYRLGNAYAEQSKYADAIAAYEIGISLGDVHENLPATEQAIHAYEHLSDKNPRNDVPTFLLGEAYLRIGGNKRALNKYQILRIHRSPYANRLRKDIAKYPNPDGFNFSGLDEIIEKEKCP